MPDWITDSFKHAPDLLAVVLIVFLFIKAMERIDDRNSKSTDKLLESHAKRTDEFIMTVKEINTEHMNAMHDTRSAIDKQAVATEQMQRSVLDNTSATRELTSAMRNKNP